MAKRRTPYADNQVLVGQSNTVNRRDSRNLEDTTFPKISGKPPIAAFTKEEIGPHSNMIK